MGAPIPARELLNSVSEYWTGELLWRSGAPWSQSSDFWGGCVRLGRHDDENKGRRIEDRYDALLLQSRLWNLLRVGLVLVPALLAVGIGYALGPYLGPLF